MLREQYLMQFEERPQERYVQRFLNRIDDTGDCWLWTGARTNEGYGTCFMPERRLVHEVSYEMFIGPIDEELEIRVECDNPACCCPHHLAATFTPARGPTTYEPAKSIANMSRKQGQSEQKLNDEAVFAILCDARLFRDIAATYGVAESTIKGIRQRKKWRWIQPPQGYQMRVRGAGNPLHPQHPSTTVCSTPDCTVRVHARGLCRHHYYLSFSR